ncbi:MAG: protein kinase domain-containing protein [Myxococcales bacterium]
MSASPKTISAPLEEFDGYRLIRPIGRGTMGQVYLARDTLLDRSVAVKFIASVDPNPEQRERFFLEARAVARLQHPNVVTIYRVGEALGQPYLISEFVRGETLDRLAKPLPWQKALRIAQGLARGLAAAHRSGVLHRDIKPANAILSDDGEAKLLDFGLAKLMDLQAFEAKVSVPVFRASAALDETVDLPGPVNVPALARTLSPPVAATLPGAVVGTPLYMAPEVWRGEPASFRSDLYSLGALLYHLCSGQPPHDRAQVPELRCAVLDSDAKPLGDVCAIEPRFAAAIDRCLRRDASERFSSADELREALDQLGAARRHSKHATENPYQGLQAFQARDRDFFFGRDGAVRELVERLRSEPFTLVVGDSGVGKSSLARAGVIPVVEDGALGEGWRTATLVPSRHPVAALAAALTLHLGGDEGEVARQIVRDPGEIPRALRQKASGFLLFIDQLEEIVTLSDPSEAADFCRALGWMWSAGPSLRVVATVRGDFLTRLAPLPGMAEQMGRALYLLRPLSREGIREAVMGPAAALGVRFESDELIHTLVEATAAADGGLPLLQFALAELWSARDRETGTIRSSALEAMGGVAGALTRHADAVLNGLRPEQRDQARRIFLDLVTADRTRARRNEAELTLGDPAAKATLDALVRGRLLVAHDATEGGAFDIAHEALIRDWPALSGWLDDTVDQRAIRDRVSRAVVEWERLGFSREALWRGAQLAETKRLDPGALPPRERRFLDASYRTVRRARWTRRLTVMAVPLVLGLVGGGIWLDGRAQLRAKVDARLAAGRAALTRSRDTAKVLDDTRKEAFALFDSRDIESGERTWSRALDLQTQAAQAYAKASRELETAFSLDGSRGDVRSLFGDVLLERAYLAEEAGRLLERDELVQRLGLFDDSGERRRRWSAPATLAISSKPEAAVEVHRYLTDSRGRRRLEEVRSFTGSAQLRDLEPGSYLVIFRAKGRAQVTAPVRLVRGERFSLDPGLPETKSVPERFVYVPPGRFLFGSAASEEQRRNYYQNVPIHPRSTAGYLIAVHETTFADWIAFLDALPAAERAKRLPRVGDVGTRGALALQREATGKWRITLQPTSRRFSAQQGETIVYPDRKSAASQDWLQFPVSGIAFDDAVAYTAWLARTGRVPRARLCDEIEWERAARGADDRQFPHGDSLDPEAANIDQTYGKEPLAFGPDTVGLHPLSRSPFGVDDMAGNVWEWVTSSLVHGQSVARGGSYYHDRNSSRIENRETPEATFRELPTGMRVCASLAD